MGEIKIENHKTEILIDTLTDEKRGFNTIVKFPVTLEVDTSVSGIFTFKYRCNMLFTNADTGEAYQNFQALFGYTFKQPSNKDLLFTIATDLCNDSIERLNFAIVAKYGHKYSPSPFRKKEEVIKMVENAFTPERN